MTTEYKVPITDGLSASQMVATDAGCKLVSAGVLHGHNRLINGGLVFFQRQVPATLTAVSDDVYGPDRWVVLTQTAAIQVARVAGTGPAIYAGQLKQNQASAQRMGMSQIVEAADSMPLRGKTVFLQAKIRCSSSQPIRIAILEWTGTADTVTSDVVKDWTSGTFTANNFFLTSSLTVTAVAAVTPDAATWTDLTVTGAVSTSCNNLIAFIWTEGTAAQNVTLDVTEVGLYVRGTITDWLPRPVQQELALCQRYFEKSYDINTAPGAVGLDGSFSSFMQGAWLLYAPIVLYKVNHRVGNAPTFYSTNNANTTGVLTEYNGASVYIADRAVTTSCNSTSHYVQAAAGAFTANNFGRWHWTADSEL